MGSNLKSFESFLNEAKFSDQLVGNGEVSYTDYLTSEKPVLFINFKYVKEDIHGNEYNVGDIMKKHIKSSEFCRFDHIHFFDGDVYCNSLKLNAYSLVFIGKTDDSYETYQLVENYCKEQGIPFLSYGYPNYLNNKYLQLQKLSSSGLKIPKTYTFNSKSTCDISFVEENFTYPLVIKPAHGSQGRGVEIIKNRKEFQSTLEALKERFLMIQEFIPNDCDYRLFFIGGQNIFSVKRSSSDKKEFRNNVSLGGTAEIIDIPIEQLTLAKRAHDCLNFYISGVDLVQNKETKEWYVLEVNSAPQYNSFGAEETIKIFADKIKAIIN